MSERLMVDNTKEKKTESLESLNPERIRDLWSRTYNSEGKPDWSHIFPYYHEDIIFEDSIQRIEGMEAFTALCERLSSRCEQLQMRLFSIVMEENEVFFDWKMQMMFRRWPSAPIYGCTKLTLGADGRIIHQRDYFDLWGDIFNEVPWFHRRYRKFLHRYFG
jgi:limonene-1,2-epoxide hydrolase